MDKKIKIEYVPITEIEPYEGNVKKHTEKQIDQIVESIKELGMNDPIAVWGENNTIVEGHGRLYALMKMGAEEVPIIRLDNLTDEQRKAYGIIHNKLTMNSGFDAELLAIELSKIDSFGMEDFGFKINEDIGIETNVFSEVEEGECLLEIECKDEENLQEVFSELLERGYECRIV